MINDDDFASSDTLLEIRPRSDQHQKQFELLYEAGVVIIVVKDATENEILCEFRVGSVKSTMLRQQSRLESDLFLIKGESEEGLVTDGIGCFGEKAL